MAEATSKTSFQQILATGLSSFWRQVYRQYLEELEHQWRACADNNKAPGDSDNLLRVLQLLSERLEDCGVRLNALRNRYRIFQSELSNETSSDARKDLLLEFCSYLGNNNRRRDRKALKRWLDEDAISERWQSRLKDQEFFSSFLMGRISVLFDQLAFTQSDEALIQNWQTLKIESLLTPWIRYTSEAKVQLAAFKSLSSVMISLHSEDTHLLSSELLRYTYRFSLDKEQQPELQIEALNLLAVADINKAISLINTRLNRDDEQEQFFFRAAIADVIALHYLNKPEIFELTEQLIKDPSPTVRQSVIRVLPICDDEKKITSILLRLSKDQSDAVYCSLVTQVPFIQHSQMIFAFLLNEIKQCRSTLRFRALCQGLISLVRLLSSEKAKREKMLVSCNQVLTQIALQQTDPKLQYIAIETREKIWASLQSELNKALAPLLQANTQKPVPLTEQQQYLLASDAGKRWLAANIGHRFTIQLQSRYLTHGTKMGFRWWRFIHELLNPATDKRQHYSHVTGRLYKSHHIIPSASMAEVSQTTVPGEPLHMAEEGHWRPFLPLVDQVISALQHGLTGKVTTLYHVAGKTEIKPPKNLFKNLAARLTLSVRFTHFSRLRNLDWDSDNPAQYVQALKKLGVVIECNGHPIDEKGNSQSLVPAVSRFFNLAVPLTVVQFYQDFQRYFVSVYQNTIQHILLFSLFMLALFWGNHALLSQRIKSARRQIPITIGGWGTRGKSGTERLKAALVNAVGLATVSKTTGCEAMFLYATRYGTLKEMFLFRPYDKATIWEQTFVTRLAAKLKSDTLCWECMGLTPRYIDILQQQWMQDDMVTITNCFPDHEDLQGPAGIDVPQVIAKFIPKNAKVWTSEENMLAYLEREARQKQAVLTPVDWLEIATIPEDLLERFPYQEHPANIALVAKMAEEMQLSRIMAIKDMADRVVPDIGVLQVFPYAKLSGRTFRFINGMSANERYGALANWQRLGYDNVALQQNGELQLVTVVNNRADRVPRSKVFAKLIAWDFPALTHFIIGNNLNGFAQFALEAFEARLKSDLSETLQPKEFEHRYREVLQFLLVPDTEESLCRYIVALLGDTIVEWQSLEQLLSSLKEVSENVVDGSTIAHIKKLSAAFEESQRHLQTLTQTGTIKADIHQSITASLLGLFKQKLHIVDDFHISGDALNQRIAASIPARIATDVLGLQNIKGPGLDFVYNWQQWQRVATLTEAIETQFGELLNQSLQELSTLPVYSSLDRPAIIRCVNELTKTSMSLPEETMAALEKIKNNLSIQKSGETNGPKSSSVWRYCLGLAEEFIDVFDAVLRGRKAKRILIDLAAQRISLQRAAWLLKTINKRQKGGWLQKSN